MGGGISLAEGGLEQLLTTTIMIGRAISAVAFPGMFRIYDFHSKKAPKLKNAKQFTFFAPDSDDEEDELDYEPPSPEQYEHFFKVVVGEDSIYLEHPLAENESGWTPLHSCCMSLSTVPAAFALIEETLRQGGHFETKTRTGPGTFNKGWTALHMACAYGAEPIVERLVQSGANVNSTNSFGFSCLLEACHRGFINVVRFLVAPVGGSPSRVDFAYLPREADAMNSPFSSAPCQAALAEAARCGFFKVVELLLDCDAPKDLPNQLGWTALHEACFYNRLETVRVLLSRGASATVRTRLGALPYHLAGLHEIRSLLQATGAAAVPSEGDVIDMIEVLTELTNPLGHSHAAASNYSISFGDSERSSNVQVIQFGGQAQTEARPPETLMIESGDAKHFADVDRLQAQTRALGLADSDRREGEADSKQSQQQPPLLHSGPLLGDLPALSPAKTSPGKQQHASFSADVERAIALDRQTGSGVPASSLFAPPGAALGRASHPSRKADSKNKLVKKGRLEEVPADMPREFVCQLTQRPMSEPVKTVYGNVYDRTAIMNWLGAQGRICPLTGAPLSEVDITPLPELGDQIRKWILSKSLSSSGSAAPAGSKGGPGDDLYDF